MVLGLDASTSVVGYAFIDGDEIHDMGFIDLKKFKTINEKAVYAYEELLENEAFNEVTSICVEDSLMGFSRGRTSTQTIIKLAKFNAVLCFILGWGTDTKVHSVNPSTARKQVFGKARVSGMPPKEFVKRQLENRFDLSKWNKQTTRGNFDKKNLDAYDALVVALYHTATSTKK
jgi:Holliday junction resolvasome RuvABC endonuclease subunit